MILHEIHIKHALSFCDNRSDTGTYRQNIVWTLMHFYNYRLKKFLVSLTKMTWQRMMSCYWMSGIRLESYLMITSLITSLRIFNIQRFFLTFAIHVSDP